MPTPTGPMGTSLLLSCSDLEAPEMLSLRDTKPSHVLISHDRNGMPDSLAVNSDNIGAIHVLRVSGRGGLGKRLSRAHGVVEYASPLLDCLVEVLFFPHQA